MKLKDILELCICHQLPFFSYRMPQNSEITTGIQLSPTIAQFRGFDSQKNGFVVAPFDASTNNKALFISANVFFKNNDIEVAQLQLLTSTTHQTAETDSILTETSKDTYLRQANYLIKRLKNKELTKVVLSRTVNKTSPTINEASDVFDRLTRIYPHAFVSIFFIPGQAVWIGATPETLLKGENNFLETMALAGTKVLDSKLEWTNKERIEQQIVSDYIENVLTKFSFDKIEKSETEEQNAGNVCHLMTKYNCHGQLSAQSLNELINNLHPTPAVGGIPKDKSLKIIRETELHNREYYAGYLGPIVPGKCQLFVNLRCVKLTKKGISYFVGGGLTADSNAEAEWDETCLKMETLSKIIHSSL